MSGGVVDAVQIRFTYRFEDTDFRKHLSTGLGDESI